MKKVGYLLLAAVLTIGLLSGCGDNTPTVTASPTASPAPSGAASDAVSTGLAIVNSIASSKDAGDEDGVAEVDSTVVAVTVSAEGKIVNCVIDQAQTKIGFDTAGQITTALDTAFMTKNELGDNYGMKEKSGLGKEWYEEAAALASYVKGKTADEVSGIAVDDTGHASDADLASSVTISISGFIDAIVKAVGNAEDYGAMAADTLSIGVVTTIDKSTNAGTEDGKAEAYSTYVAVTYDGSGVVTSCIIDASQSDVNFDASGKITSDLTAAPPTKDELGYDYGMKAKSGLGKEWFEEAASFASYVTGKTLSEIDGIAVDDEGHPTGSDLTSSVTISIGGFQTALAKALDQA